MKMEGRPPRSNLYPDLSQFYNHTGDSPSSSSSPSSHNLPPPPPPQQPQRRLPTAPPLTPLHDDSVPEEPEKDYMQDVVDNHPDTLHDCTVDYPQGSGGDDDLDARLGDLTIDYTLDNRSLDSLLELEPDYDMDDLQQQHQHQQDTLNNLNLTASEKKILHTKNIEVPEPPRNDRDFRAWMTWRLQANKMLAAVILMRKGHQVHVRRSEIRRKPLTPQNVQKVVQQARRAEEGGRGGAGGRKGGSRGSAERTSLPACPYVMYGIPRVNLPSQPSQP